MEINGLPLHPLVVHAAVVLGPLGAVTALVFLLPQWRARVRWPMVALALLATTTIVAAYLTGRPFLSSRPPEIRSSPMVLTHEHRARILLWVTLGFGLVAVLAGWFATRTGPLRLVLSALLAVAALAVLVMVALTGEAGARAVWG